MTSKLRQVAGFSTIPKDVPYTELELRNLIATFSETLATLTHPDYIERKKRDIAWLQEQLDALAPQSASGKGRT